MSLDIAGVLRDAWAMARRDREMLIGVAGLFVFLPDLLQALFVAPWPPLPATSDPAAADAWVKLFLDWAQRYELIAIACAIVALFGILLLFRLYSDRERPTVAAALGRGVVMLLPYLLLAYGVLLSVAIGWLLFYLPGLYLKGRLLPVSPVFLGERPVGIFAAWRRSFALTRGHGLVLMGLACVPLLGGALLGLPFELTGKLMDGAPMANPVVAVILDAGASLAHTVATIAAILIEVALYRRLSRGM